MVEPVVVVPGFKPVVPVVTSVPDAAAVVTAGEALVELVVMEDVGDVELVTGPVPGVPVVDVVLVAAASSAAMVALFRNRPQMLFVSSSYHTTAISSPSGEMASAGRRCSPAVSSLIRNSLVKGSRLLLNKRP